MREEIKERKVQHSKKGKGEIIKANKIKEEIKKYRRKTNKNERIGKKNHFILCSFRQTLHAQV
jgi:hypothetical protein